MRRDAFCPDASMVWLRREKPAEAYLAGVALRWLSGVETSPNTGQEKETRC